MFWGEVQIGRLTLTEGFEVKESSGSSDGRELQLSGQESWPPLADADEVRYRGEQLMAMDGLIVPVLFSNKSNCNGFYVINKPSVDFQYFDGVVSACDWSVTLIRLGTEAEVQFESRLVGGNRTSYYAGNTPERWHSAPSAHVGYYTGASVPGQVLRTGTDGAVIVYRDLAQTASPRWGVTPSNYLRGGCKVTINNQVQCGLTNPNTPSSWSIENSLIKISNGDSTATFHLATHEAGTYSDTYADDYGSGTYVTSSSSEEWRVNIGGTLAIDPSYVNILRNDPEECVIRLTFTSAAGYSTLDLSLRRGSRFVSVVAKHENSTVFTVYPATSSAATNPGNGYIYKTTTDGHGNRFVIGSASRVNVNTTSGRLENTIPATVFDFFVGIESGGSVLNGDFAADLASQYLGTPAEIVRTVHR